MEFLHPPQNDAGQIILIVIVIDNRKAKMIWYQWSSGTNLRHQQLQANQHVLPSADSLPLLLIPFTRSTAFMLVSEAQNSIYEDILTGTPRRSTHAFLAVKSPEPEEPGSSRRLPIWTQWARPTRPVDNHLTQMEDAIYLCREDGVVQYLTWQSKGNHALDSIHQAGRLGKNVDSAFAVLDVGPNTVDLLVAGGNESEGGLWRMWARQEPKLQSVIPNWSSLHNLTSIPLSNDQRSAASDLATASSFQQRILACSGRGMQSSISELHYGFEASQMFSFELAGDAIDTGVLRVWAFHGFFGDPQYQFQGPESRNDRTYILISHPTQTSIISIHLQPMSKEGSDQRLGDDPELMVKEVNLDLPFKTIFAGTTLAGAMLLVTESSIMAYSISASVIKPEERDDVSMKEIEASRQETIELLSHYQIPFPDMRILAACMYRDPDRSVLLLAVQDDQNFHIQLGDFDTEFKQRGSPVLIQSQPSCVHLNYDGKILVAFVATLDGELYTFQVDDQGLLSSSNRPYSFLGHFAICESIAHPLLCDDQDSQTRCFIVCGLRNGRLQILQYTTEGSRIDLEFFEEIVIGDTTVNVATDRTRESRVFVQCEHLLCALEYPTRPGVNPPARIHRIWASDRDQSFSRRSNLSAITQVIDSWLPQGVPGLSYGALLSVNNVNQVHLLHLEDRVKPHLVPHRLATSGSTRRMIYSGHLKKLIVLSDKLTLTHDSSGVSKGIRRISPTLTFVDPDSGSSVSANPDVSNVEAEENSEIINNMLLSLRKPSEQITGLTEWFPKFDDNEYYLIILSTMYKENGKFIGRLFFFSLPNRSNRTYHSMDIQHKYRLKLDAPVYSVVTHPDRRSIVYCSGSHLYVHSLASTLSGFRWEDPVKVAMRSQGRSLSIREPYIYVSSARESLAVFKYTQNKLTYQYGDELARDGLHHLHIPESSLILASDMTNAAIGLWQPPERRNDNAMITVFEALLPVSINRLQWVVRPNWLRDPEHPSEDRSIIGSSEDGTIIQFDILAEGWRLLRFIQNMAERSEVVCPFRDQGPHRRCIEPSTRKPHHKHIKGDIIQRALNRGAEELIKQMLDEGPDGDGHTDLDSAETRWCTFRELASEVVDMEDPNWLTEVVQWTKYRLRSAL